MISKDQVIHIASLARLSLSKKDLERFQKELSAILDFIEKLNKADTRGIQTIRQVCGFKNVMREDEAKEIEDQKNFRKKFLENAPQTKDGYIKVRAVFE